MCMSVNSFRVTLDSLGRTTNTCLEIITVTDAYPYWLLFINFNILTRITSIVVEVILIVACQI